MISFQKFLQAFGNANNTTTPSMIGKLPYSQEVACGGYHTCVITSNFLVSLQYVHFIFTYFCAYLFVCLNVVVYKNQCHLIALCYKRCEYEGLEAQGCAENKNPNSIKIRCLVIFDNLDRLVERQFFRQAVEQQGELKDWERTLMVRKKW